jgi:hypothetical protein
MASTIVLPNPCLSEKLAPKDFEFATRVMAPAGDLVAARLGAAGVDRRGERARVFDPGAAPWRRQLGAFRQP